MEIQRAELATTEDPRLDVVLSAADFEGVNRLIIESLMADGYNTPRAILTTTPEQLMTIPGLNRETADKIINKILEKIRK